MEKYYKALKKVLIAIGITFVISLGIILYLNLSQPVVLKQYVDICIEEIRLGDEIFSINYIINAHDNRALERIEFPEAEGSNLYAKISSRAESDFLRYHGDINEEIIGRYKLVTAHLPFISNDYDRLNDQFTITKARLYFSDTDYIDVDIGQINFYSEVDDFVATLKYMDSTYLSDNDFSMQFLASEDMELLEIRSDLLEEFNDYVHFTVDGVSYKDIEGKIYKQGDYINIASIIDFLDNEELKNYDYDINPEFIYMDKEGNINSERIDIIRYRSDFFERRAKSSKNRFNEMIRFLKARGELQ